MRRGVVFSSLDRVGIYVLCLTADLVRREDDARLRFFVFALDVLFLRVLLVGFLLV